MEQYIQVGDPGRCLERGHPWRCLRWPSGSSSFDRFAVGAHEVSKAATWKNVRLITLIFNIGGAFFAFVVGGWVAADRGFRRAEPVCSTGDRVVGHASDLMLLAPRVARQLWRVLGSLAGFTPRRLGFLGDRYGGGHAQYCAVELTGVLVGLMAA